MVPPIRQEPLPTLQGGERRQDQTTKYKHLTSLDRITQLGVVWELGNGILLISHGQYLLCLKSHPLSLLVIGITWRGHHNRHLGKISRQISKMGLQDFYSLYRVLWCIRRG